MINILNILKRYNAKNILIIALTLLLITATGLTIYFYNQYNAIKNNPDSLEKQETQQIVQKISQFMELPKEEPSLATITDKAKLYDQLFFKNAENGDKLLIFTQSGQAILYRLSINKIINVAPINLQASQTTTTK